jgi:hypothetical protein
MAYSSSFSLRALAAAGAALVLSVVAHAAEPAIIAKARARIGTEAAIDGVKSIHYVGTLVTADPVDATKQSRAAIDIVFQKENRQRVRATSDKTIETTALDGYEAWKRVEPIAEPAKWQQTYLNAANIKGLRANTWETLGFFRGIEARGGRIEDKGPATIDGIACQKLAFIYGPGIAFYRYFDLATGRLVFTETETGSTVREQGEIVVDGLRFPKTLVMTNKLADGKIQTVTITIEKVTVNEVFPSTFFAVPTLSNKK